MIPQGWKRAIVFAIFVAVIALGTVGRSAEDQREREQARQAAPPVTYGDGPQLAQQRERAKTKRRAAELGPNDAAAATSVDPPRTRDEPSAITTLASSVAAATGDLLRWVWAGTIDGISVSAGLIPLLLLAWVTWRLWRRLVRRPTT